MAYSSYMLGALKNKAPNANIEGNTSPKLEWPKCHYPISIYTELKQVFASDDYFSGFRYLIGNQPLEDVPGDEKARSEIVTVEADALDENPRVTIIQPHIKKLEQGIEDLQDFTVNFMYNNPKIRCKEGFADLLLANFAKYNNPSKFAEHRIIFESDNAPCGAYEDESICPSLPMDAYEFIEKIGELALNFYNGGEYK